MPPLSESGGSGRVVYGQKMRTHMGRDKDEAIMGLWGDDQGATTGSFPHPFTGACAFEF